MPLVAGGIFGLLILTRGHTSIMAPLLLGIFLIASWRVDGLRWQVPLLFALGSILTLASWFLRNYEYHGRLLLQDPISTYTSQMAGIYSMTPSLQLQAESLTRSSSNTDPEYYESLRQQVVDFVIQHPGEVFHFVSSHYFHNLIYSFIYLPHSFRIESLKAYVTAEPFWHAWQGGLSPENWILLCLNLALFSLGLGSAWDTTPAFRWEGSRAGGLSSQQTGLPSFTIHWESFKRSTWFASF